ncbi:unnamed protein product [marine sediment metagenome]|uniref:CHAD domain-containing protein n=1 Tax=marine sediment metagenome TaxID=412755 RepID=X0SLX3_9ZZZZ
MIDRLKCQPAELNAIQTDRVLRGLEQRRKDVQPQMQAALDQIDQQSLKRQFARLADKVRWRGAGKEPDWKSAMTQILGRVASSFRDSGKPLEGATDLHDRIGELHRLRIWGKQLRYTMEIAVGAFGKPLRELYDVVEQTQTFLGVINDHAVARNFYQTWYEQESDRALANSLRALAALEQIGLEQSLCKFPAWWNSPSVGEFWLRWEERIGAFPTALGADNEDGAVPDEAQIKKKGA